MIKKKNYEPRGGRLENESGRELDEESVCVGLHFHEAQELLGTREIME